MATSMDKAQPDPNMASDASTLPLANTTYHTVTSGQTSSTTSFSDTDLKDVEKNEPAEDEATKEKAEAAPAVAGQTPPINPMHPSQFPDGGTRAWMVVFGAHCALFVSFGNHPLAQENVQRLTTSRLDQLYWCLPGVLRNTSAQKLHSSRDRMDSIT